VVEKVVPYNNLLTVTDADNNTTTYGYDARNLRTSEQYPDAAPNTRTYTYDGANRLSSRLDGRNLRGQRSTLDKMRFKQADANGNTMTYGYDDQNRRISTTIAAGETSTTTFV
jgi:YD repeat-containing protein